VRLIPICADHEVERFTRDYDGNWLG
jgi:hypothetical protein